MRAGLDPGSAKGMGHALVARSRERPHVGREVHPLGPCLVREGEEHTLG